MRETQLPNAGINVAIARLSCCHSLGRIMPRNVTGLKQVRPMPEMPIRFDSTT
jgi:hypothetical protein